MHDQIGDIAVDKQLTGSSPTISLAGTRLSEQPIQRYFGACCSESRRKKPGSFPGDFFRPGAVILEELGQFHASDNSTLGPFGKQL
jgi:hypothetical protein